ncbi:hypothetical protein Tco_0288356, partial [Tanacetum coccineum]
MWCVVLMVVVSAVGGAAEKEWQRGDEMMEWRWWRHGSGVEWWWCYGDSSDGCHGGRRRDGGAWRS